MNQKTQQVFQQINYRFNFLEQAVGKRRENNEHEEHVKEVELFNEVIASLESVFEDIASGHFFDHKHEGMLQKGFEQAANKLGVRKENPGNFIEKGYIANIKSHELGPRIQKALSEKKYERGFEKVSAHLNKFGCFGTQSNYYNVSNDKHGKEQRPKELCRQFSLESK